MKGLMRSAARLFNAPLMIERRKAEIIAGIFESKLRGDTIAISGAGDDEEAPDPCEGVAIIPVYGSLVHRTTGLDALSGMVSYKTLADTFDEAIADDAVKGILFDFDSYGGEVAGVFDLTDRIFKARGAKPIYAVADESMYSAAYALGSAADRIYVPRTAGAGSIGVLAMHRDQSGFDKQLGLKFTTIFAGARKNDGNPHEPLSVEATKLIQATVDKTYGLFVDTVARNRGISAEKVRATEAGIFQGGDAVAAGLADVVGTYEQALADLQAVAAKAASETDKAVRARIYALGAVPNLHATAGDGGAQELPPPGTSAGPHPGNGKGDTMPDATKPKDDESQGKKPADTAKPAATNQGAEGAPVVDLDAARSEGEARALAYVREVNELCAMAGTPEKAADFIAKKVKAEDVRSALLAGKASKTDAGTISAHNPGKQPQAADHGWSKIAAATGTFGGGYSPAGRPAKR